MGILNLKNKTADKFIKNQRNVAASQGKKMPEKIMRVGVLAELSLMQTYDFSKRLGQGLNVAHEYLRVFLFDPSKGGKHGDSVRSCSEKDFGLNGKIKSEALNKFVSRDFDLLINYCNPELLFPKVIMLRSAAKLKAGYEDESNFFNDISIHVPNNDIDTFNEELIKYLEILNLIKK